MRKVRVSYKIKVKTSDKFIIFITFLCFIATLSFSLISFYNSRKNQINLKEIDLKQYSNECKNSIDQYFKYNFDVLEYLASYPEVYDMEWEEQYTFLLDQKERLNFEHFIVMDLQGKGYYTNRNEIKDQSQEQFFSDVINNERFLTEPYIEFYEDRAITTLSVFIYKDGEKVGALCGVLDLSEIYQIFEEKIVGNNGYGFLVNSNGDYIAHKNKEYIFNSNNFLDNLDQKENDIQLVKECIKSKDIEVIQILIQDNYYYSIFTPLDSANWNLVFVIPESEFLLGLNNFAIFQIVSSIFAVLFIIFAMKIIFKSRENHKLAYTDSLTNVNNRAAVDSILKKLEYDYKSSITIVCFDLNDFKYINDTYGHNSGDELLGEFANILNKTFGDIGFVARMGGDEFISVLLNKDILDIEYKFKKMENLISEYNNKSIYKIKTSYGYATREVGKTTLLQSIYEQADNNMYMFKRKCKRG